MNSSHPNSGQGVFVVEDRVRPEWIDLNGHMNVAYYVLAFDQGVDALWTRVGITGDYIRSRMLSTFAVESHITYRAELKEAEPYRITTQILAVDAKRVHQLQWMYHAEEGYLAATAEWMNLHVDLKTRRVCPWPDDVRSAFIDIAETQKHAAVPEVVGKTMRIQRPLYELPGYGNQRNFS